MKPRFHFWKNNGHPRWTLSRALVVACAIGSSQAATLTWTGAGNDNNILTGANWNTGNAPALSGDALIFTGSSWLLPTLSENRSVASLTFNSAASSFTLGGTGIYTLTASGGIVNSSVSNVQTINNNLVFGTTQTWATNAGSMEINGNIANGGFLLTISHNTGTTTINGIISGTGAFTKSGTGTVVLSGANTYSGLSTLGAGNVVIGSNSALGTGEIKFNSKLLNLSALAGGWSLANTYTLSQNLLFSGANSLTLSGTGSFSKNRTFTVSGEGVLTLSGNLSGNKILTKAGSGTLVLSGNNAIASVTLSAGTLYAGHVNALGTGTLSLGTASFGSTSALNFANALTFAGNTSFVGSSAITFNGNGALTAARTLTFDGSSPVTFNGVISGSGFGITKSGDGTMVLSGTSANTFSGLTKVTDGQLTLAKTAGLNAIAGALEIGNGSGDDASSIVQLNAANQIIDTSAVSIFSDGQLRLQSFSDTVGALTLYGGSITGSGSLGLGGNLTFSGTNGTTASISSGLAMTAARTFLINSNGLAGLDLTISGNITGAFAATKTSEGNLLLSGTNTFSGGYNANHGITVLGSSGALGTAAANLGDTTGSNSASLLFGESSGFTVANAITVRSGSSGTATLGGWNNSGTNTFTGAITLNKSVTLTAEAGGEVAFSTGAITGTGGFTKIGAGTIRLSGANSSSGAMLISEGTLAMGASNTLGSGSLTINGGILDFGANRTDSVAVVVLDNDSSILGSGTSTLTSTASFDIRSGLIQVGLAGSVGLTKSTTGTVTLSGAGTYTGTTTISAGALNLGLGNALPTATALSISSGATLNLQNHATQSGSLTGAGSIQLGSGTLTTGGLNTSTSFSGIISGTGGLAKTGTGTLTLSGSNTYSGATTLNGGTLTLGKSSALNPLTAVTINSGTLSLGSYSQTIGGLAGSGSVTMAGGTFGIGAANLSTTFSGNISGSGSLVKSGTGVLTLSSASTTTASLLIDAGTVTLTGASGTLVSVTAVTLNSGGSLVLDNSTTENANRIGNSTSIQFNGGVFSLISDSNGTNESVGSLIVQGGSSTVNILHNGGTATASILTFSSLGTVSNGATVDFTSTGGTLGASATGPQILITGQSQGLLGGWATVGADAAEYFIHGIRAYSDYYDDALGINLNNATKIVRLTGASVSAAGILSNAGITTNLGLNLTDIPTVDLGTSSSRTLNLLNGSLIKSTATPTTIQGAGFLTAGGTAAGNLNASVTSGSSLTIHSVISNNTGGAVGLTKGDLGTLTLGAANTFTGNVFINGGVLSISSEGNLGSGSKQVIFNGGTLRISSGFNASSAKVLSVSAGLSGTLDIQPSQTLTLADSPGMLTSGSTASTLIKTGTGSLVIQNANAAFNGILRLDQGITELRNGGSAGSGVLHLNGGTLTLSQNTSTAFNNSGVMLANSIINVSRTSGSGSVTHTLGNIDLGARTLTVTGDGSATLQLAGITLTGSGIVNPTTADLRAGVISGSNDLTKTGSGALILSGSSTYTGATNINAGTLRLALANVIPDASTVSLASGTNFDLAGFSETIGALSGAGNVSLGTATLTTGAGTSTFSGSISGSGGLVKNGAGTFTLSGASTYSGATTVSAGVLAMSGTNRLASTTDLTVASGATFQLNGNATATGSLAGAGTLSLGSGTFTTGSASSTFSGLISGSGGLVKSGSGILTLSGASTYSGSTSIQGGTLVMRSSTALGAATGPVSVSAGSVLALENNISVSNSKTLTLAGSGISNGGALINNSGTNTWAGGFSLSADSTIHSASGGTLVLSGAGALGASVLTLDGAGSITLSGVVSGSSGLVKNGTGTSILSGANTYTGTTTVSQGTLRIGNNSALGASGSGNDTIVSAGATLLLQPPSGLTIGNEWLTLNGTGSGGVGALYSQTGTNSWAGAITLASDSTIRVDSGSVLNLIASMDQSGGAKSLTKDGAGTLTISGLVSTSGSILLQGGILQLGASERLNDLIALNLSSGTTFDLNNNDETIGSLTGSGSVTLGSDTEIGGGDLTFGANHTSTSFSGVISGLGAVTKTGTGTQTLTVNQTYTGATTIEGGVLSVASLANGGANSGIGASTSDAANLVLDGGTLRYTGGAQSTNRNFTIGINGGAFDASGTGALTLSGTATLDDIDTERTLTLTGTNTAANTLAAALGDNGLGATSLLKSGTGTWVLSGAHSYTGSTSVTGGTLRLASANRIGDSSSVIVSSGAIFDFNNFSDTIGSLAGAGNITLGSAAMTTGANHTSTTFSGIISGTGAVIKTGTGTQVFSGNNSYTGITTISGGTLSVASLANGGQASGIGASSNAAANLVINGGTLRHTGGIQSTDRNFTIGINGATLDASGSGALTFSSASTATLSGTNTARTLTLTGTSTAANSLTAVIADNGNGKTSLTKSGAGTWVLKGANTYTGATTVSGGTLAVASGASLGATTTLVNSGATLQNNGSITGLVTANGTVTGNGLFNAAVTLNSTHSPGTSPGVQTFASGLKYASTAVLQWELANNTSDLGLAGTEYDQVKVTGGSFELATGAAVDLLFNLAESGVDFSNGFWSASRSWSLVTLSGTATANPGNATFTVRSVSLDRLGQSHQSYGTFSTSILNGNQVLHWTVISESGSMIPEPESTMLMVLGASLLLRRRRNAT